MTEERIPLVGEELEVSKRRHVTGMVRVDKEVRTEDVPVEMDLVTEEVAVRRLPVDRLVPGPIPDRWEGDTLIVSVVEEVLVVEKRLKLVEEVHITRTRRTRHTRRMVSRRREEARVTRS